MPKYHSANLTLNRLRDECTELQNFHETKLVHLQAADVAVVVNGENQFNEARYAEVEDLTQIPDLVFTSVASSEEALTAHSDMVAAGGYFIFDELLYIKNEKQRVFGYGVLP